jgi:hypothetical protein
VLAVPPLELPALTAAVESSPVLVLLPLVLVLLPPVLPCVVTDVPGDVEKPLVSSPLRGQASRHRRASGRALRNMLRSVTECGRVANPANRVPRRGQDGRGRVRRSVIPAWALARDRGHTTAPARR